MKARIVLEDGTIFTGKGFGAKIDVIGEIVFNTSMMGYQEILTDPSYCYQIVTMTYPLIGNYGINEDDMESKKIQVSGFIVKEYSKIFSNMRATGSLSDFLVKHNIPAVEGVDTRYITRLTRTKGSMMGIISFDEKLSDNDLLEQVKKAPKMSGLDLAKEVSTDKKYVFTDPDVEPIYNVFAYDYGIKSNILRMLAKNHCKVTVVPADYPAEKILAAKPDGIFLSNGPGDPEPLKYAVDNIQKIMNAQIPLFGICLGHQLLGLAIGGKTYKLKFGHRGGNQPVKKLSNSKVEITSQNHGFAVDGNSLPLNDIEVTHVNLNDDTVEGIRCKNAPAFSVQYHPEANPGPHDSHYLFREFVDLMNKCRK